MTSHTSLRQLGAPSIEARRTWARTFTGKAAVISAGEVELAAELTVPPGATGAVVFAHGSGSNRLSPRNRVVADTFHDAHLATLLFDLLGPDESLDRRKVFDVPLLGTRLVAGMRWLRAQPEIDGVPVGCFGASTGAAAALWAAAEPGAGVRAVVSRGGRPDLAGDRLPRVEAPTLLVVGGDDAAVLELNRLALAELRCERELAVVAGATHLFEEPGALEQVAELATAWFAGHLR